ncbi:MAG: Glutamyl-tRNA synthetase @ Glutamyl-tRNA(Gln) synthetase, partial [uncultured Quadrisphaera sp.]
ERPGDPRPRQRGAGALLPQPDRRPARRDGAHGAVQLGVRPAHRRQAGLPHRGHRRGPRLRGELPPAARRPALARSRLGRGRRGRRPPRAVPAVPARGAVRRRARPPARGGPRLRVLLHPRGGRGATPRRRPRPEAGLRRGRPHDHRGGARRPPRAGPPAGAPAGHARHRHRRRRPRPRADHLPRGRHAGLRGGPGERGAAVHPGQPRGRRADGHHARAARRGPALLDAPAGGAVRRADRRRGGRRRARVRAPAVRAGGGQPQALQARPRVEPVPAPRARLHPRGAAQLPVAPGVVDRARPRRVHPRRAGRGLRRGRRHRRPGALRPGEGGGDQRRAPATARAGGLPRPRRAAPARGGPGRRAPERARAAGADRGGAPGAGADRAARRGAADAGVPLHPGRRPRRRGRRAGRAAPGGGGGAGRRGAGAGAGAALGGHRDRAGAAGGAGRRARHQAEVRLRAGAHRGHRPPRLAAAVRVAGDPGAGQRRREDVGAACEPGGV